MKEEKQEKIRAKWYQFMKSQGSVGISDWWLAQMDKSLTTQKAEFIKIIESNQETCLEFCEKPCGVLDRVKAELERKRDEN